MSHPGGSGQKWEMKKTWQAHICLATMIRQPAVHIPPLESEHAFLAHPPAQPLAVAIVLCLVSVVFGFVVLGWPLPVFHWSAVCVLGLAHLAL